MTDTIQAVSRSLSADVATLNTISHNVANLNTPGFRAERSTAGFQAQLEQGAPTVAIDQSDGAVSTTGRPLDLALRGHGFFQVQRGEQTVLVRAGSFRIDADGWLVNARGDRVLGDGGPLQPGTVDLRIDAQGQVRSGDRVLGQLQLVDVADPSRLVPANGGGFIYDGPMAEFTGHLQPGALEHANVDAAAESVRLMELSRHVESLQHAISIYDKTMDTGINRLGEN